MLTRPSGLKEIVSISLFPSGDESRTEKPEPRKSGNKTRSAMVDFHEGIGNLPKRAEWMLLIAVIVRIYISKRRINNSPSGDFRQPIYRRMVLSLIMISPIISKKG